MAESVVMGVVTTNNSENDGFLGDDNCALRARWRISDNEAGDSFVNFTSYITKIVISKSMRTLTPFVTIELRPSALDIVKNGIRAKNTIILEIKKAEKERARDASGNASINKLEWAFRGELFPADFEFHFHRTQSQTKNKFEDATNLRLFLYPVFYNKLMNMVKPFILDKPKPLNKKFLEDLIKDTTELEFSEFVLDDLDKKILLPKQFIIYKTRLLDMLRYLAQRFGFYESQPLLYTDFAPLDQLSDDESAFKPAFYLRSLEKIDDITFGLYFVNTKNKDNSATEKNGVPYFYIYKSGIEVDKRPENVLKMKHYKDYLVLDRENLCKITYLDLEEVQFSLKPLRQNADVLNFDFLADEWKIEDDTITVNTRDTQISPMYYFSDLYEETSQLTYRPSFWIGWRFFNIGKMVRVEVTDPDYVKDGHRLAGNYMIKDVSVAVIRHTGGQHAWELRSEYTLIRRVSDRI